MTSTLPTRTSILKCNFFRGQAWTFLRGSENTARHPSSAFLDGGFGGLVLDRVKITVIRRRGGGQQRGEAVAGIVRREPFQMDFRTFAEIAIADFRSVENDSEITAQVFH